LRGISPDDLYQFRWVDHVRLDAGGSKVAFCLTEADASARDYRSRISVAGLSGAPGDRPRELTEGKRDRSPEWAPDGHAIAYTSRQAGRDQVFVVPVEGGEPVALTSIRDGASAPRWSRDGSRLAFLGTCLSEPDAVVDDPRPPENEDHPRRPPVVRVTRRLDYRHDGQGYVDGRHRHLFVMDPAVPGSEPLQVTGGAWTVEEFDWAPESDRWAVTGNAEPDADLTIERHLYVADVAGRRRLTQGLVASTPAWSPRGDLIAFISPLTADGGRHERVWVVPPDGGEARCLTAELDRSVGGTAVTDMRAGHAMALVWSEDGSRIYFQAAGRGTADICSVDLEGSVRVEVESRHRAIYDFDVRAGTIAFLSTDPWSPGDLYVKRDGVETRLSDFNPWLGERDLPIPERHVFRAADGVELDGWLIKPPGFDGRPAPLVLQVHGGPHGQYGWAFFHEFLVFAAMGLLVLLVNPRGSDGRDEAFKRAVIQDWGGKDFEDLMAALDQVIERTGFVDRARLGVAGGSYGGYMTNWAIGQTDRFAAAVTMRSIANLVSEYGQHDIVPWGRNELGPEPWPDADALWQRSPIRYVRNVRTPLLIIHGETDFRCAISQAEEFFGALRLLGKEVEFARFPGESHDLSRSGRPDRRVERLVRMAGWFGRHLLGAGEETGAEVSAAQPPPAEP
jgi:dipeptidyl aminopeptidase/acylaminoacyl peptidase